MSCWDWILPESSSGPNFSPADAFCAIATTINAATIAPRVRRVLPIDIEPPTRTFYSCDPGCVRPGGAAGTAGALPQVGDETQQSRNLGRACPQAESAVGGRAADRSTSSGSGNSRVNDEPPPGSLSTP